jgi:hypothetical protein
MAPIREAREKTATMMRWLVLLWRSSRGIRVCRRFAIGLYDYVFLSKLIIIVSMPPSRVTRLLLIKK